jgi:hypothetical protein
MQNAWPRRRPRQPRWGRLRRWSHARGHRDGRGVLGLVTIRRGPVNPDDFDLERWAGDFLMATDTDQGR